MAEKAKLEDVDRISDLHDSILSHILSFLSTKQAVKTSFLSSRWRYLFTLVPNLNFDFYFDLRYRNWRECCTVESFTSFVDRVMFLHNKTNVNVNQFRLYCGEKVDHSRVYGWISDVLCRGVKHLDLTIYFDKFTLPHDLFACRTLMTLKLYICFDLNVPKDVCLPNLKTLHLKRIKFTNDESVKSLISSCISLEDLVMDHCSMENLNISHNLLKRLELIISSKYTYSLVIDTPALVYLKYNSEHAAGEYSLKNLESLVEADIEIGSHDKHQAEATSFFEGISNVHSLILSSNSLKLLDSCGADLIFPNLVHLKIWISICYNKSQSEPTNLPTTSYEPEQNLTEIVPFSMLYKLREVEISRFEADKDCIGKAKYFLQEARVLRKLTIRIAAFTRKEDRMKIFEELWAYPRQSKECCVFIV